MLRILSNYQQSVFPMIHRAIHDKIDILKLAPDHLIMIQTAPNGCRYAIYDNIKFMEQNKSKSSEYAKRAREGERITWGITNDGGKWILITDKGIEV